MMGEVGGLQILMSKASNPRLVGTGRLQISTVPTIAGDSCGVRPEFLGGWANIVATPALLIGGRP